MSTISDLSVPDIPPLSPGSSVSTRLQVSKYKTFSCMQIHVYICPFSEHVDFHLSV